MLADRALNGIEEVVYYHGEEIARRRRYDSRLLLAHLGRLDRADERDEVREVSADFDAALERLARGEPVDPLAEPARDDAHANSLGGPPWEDECLPLVERALRYLESLEEDDEDAERGEDDWLPAPDAPGGDDDELEHESEPAGIGVQDRVTPVTLQHRERDTGSACAPPRSKASSGQTQRGQRES